MLKPEPLFMPKGSVRAILAILIIGGYVWSVLAGWTQIPTEIVMAVLGFYFLERKGN